MATRSLENSAISSSDGLGAREWNTQGEKLDVPNQQVQILIRTRRISPLSWARLSIKRSVPKQIQIVNTQALRANSCWWLLTLQGRSKSRLCNCL